MSFFDILNLSQPISETKNTNRVLIGVFDTYDLHFLRPRS